MKSKQFSIAFAGKGGVGKTALCSLVIRYLLKERQGSVLAVDADPSGCLAPSLDMALEGTLGDIREDVVKGGRGLPGGMTKDQYLEYRITGALSEGERIDLIAMGRPEGPGCYCFVNSLLRRSLDRLCASYDYVAVDCEAGLEHLSRRTTRKVDCLAVVTDPTVKGAQAAMTIGRMAERLDLESATKVLLVNKVPLGARDKAFAALVERTGIDRFAGRYLIPSDEAIAAYDLEGRPLIDVPEESPAYRAVRGFAEEVVP